MAPRFVQPMTTTLKISGGATLIVKRRLNWGEHNDLMESMASPRTPGDAELRANPFAVRLNTVLAYLVDWTLVDEDGAPVPILKKPDAEVRLILRELEQDVMEEIYLAISAHQAAQEKEREAEKNGQGGASVSLAISPSPDAAAGGMSGSEI
jgi:hypothetical protein